MSQFLQIQLILYLGGVTAAVWQLYSHNAYNKIVSQQAQTLRGKYLPKLNLT